MKKIILVVIIVIGFQLNAQKSIEKKIPIDNATNISIDFPYASFIDINTWAKDEVYIKATVTIDDGKLNDHFEFEVKKRLNTLYIEASYGKLFKKEKGFFSFLSNKDASTIIKIGNEENGNQNSVNGISIKTVYTIFVPQNLNVELNSNSANVTIPLFDGNLVTDIISGTIQVGTHHGDMTLKTVSGSITIKIDATDAIDAKTTLGNIFKKGQIPKLIIGEKIVGSFATRNLSNENHAIILSTITGDIHLSDE
ncbi:hypothetical protein GCM10011344_11640 [Dokdonia pacifica]|uniref:Adhesin n=1 Tax=Dokdonia pacifica TaxID=1627892 RepID=A0A238YGN5_9FLAO|nr:hypothetical protein [Dokdonia pacifica]GGG12609.1 hypothetical protein GCM10011344_11640 [Dokdonia pacifica]SNR69891.1 hypothetical protein SAMN06265376_10229 [Dokdonia pacifica]